ncbi:MerR family transcriptional regulator [Serratia symbiotica]|uniref:MerR family transcriptional regulator n=1 Tax=Serratia symbiotica TaxID=138074 RepID=UPI003464B7C9
MLLYSIGEVAQLCDINPVTLRTWQRRYGLLKPKRSEGGHRLFDNEDVARIRAIRIWIERGVPVNMVKALLDGKAQPDHTANWALLQQQLLTLLHTPSPSKLRRRLFELGREYPAERLIENVLRPLRNQLSGDHELLQMLRGLLDGVIIEYATFCMIRARKKTGPTALLLGWHNVDHIELWLEAIILAKNGMHIDILPGTLTHPQPQLFKADHYFIHSRDKPNTLQQKMLAEWWSLGLNIRVIGSSVRLIEQTEPSIARG